MPLDDFTRQISPKDQPDFDQLSACATRYDVSLVAAVLRWLRYTDRRSMIVVSRDGFMKWAWLSEPALKSGRYFRTIGTPVAVPALSSVVTFAQGVNPAAGVWFDEPVKELSMRSGRYDLSYALLHWATKAAALRWPSRMWGTRSTGSQAAKQPLSKPREQQVSHWNVASKTCP